MTAGETNKHARTPRSTVGTLAAVWMAAVWLMVVPSLAEASEPARLSFGLSAQFTQWRIEAPEEAAGTDGDSVFNVGALLAVDVHRYFSVQGEVIAPYSIQGSVDGRAEPFPRAVELDSLKFVGANGLLRYRPLGRSEFAPVLGAGLAWRTFLDGFIMREGDDEDAHAGQFVDEHQWQGLAAAGLDWNSGWRTGSTHLSAEMRVYGPPAALASTPSNDLGGLETWSWEVWLGCRLSVW